jgi:hypothetical protein
MKINFHVIPFKHSCGNNGTVLEMAARSDGTLAVSGVCIHCGVDFDEAYPWYAIMCSCSIMDYKRCQEFGKEDVFEDFVPIGKPN